MIEALTHIIHQEICLKTKRNRNEQRKGTELRKNVLIFPA